MDVSQALAAPQATLMTTIAQGVFSHKMDWTMLMVGVFVGLSVIVVDFLLSKSTLNIRIPALAIGMGIYLPPTITMPLVIGAVLSWIIHRKVRDYATRKTCNEKELQKAVEQKGALIASGLIVGESLVGVLMAVIIVISISSGGSDAPLSIAKFVSGITGGSLFSILVQLCGLAIFVAICINFCRRSLSAIKETESTP